MPDPVTDHYPRDPALTSILEALKGGVPESITVTHRFRLIQHIVRSCHDRAREHNLYEKDAQGGVSGFRPGCFTEEDTALALLYASVPFSPTFEDFFERNAQELGRTLAAAFPLAAQEKRWRKMDPLPRQGFLDTVAHAQCALFNHESLVFAPPPLTVGPLAHGVLGAFTPGVKPLAQHDDQRRITISDNHLHRSPMTRIVETLWHENTHALCQQFAAASAGRAIHPLSPFHEDAAILREKLSYRAVINTGFPRAYAAEPEENIARRTQETLIRSWKDHSGWRGVMRRIFT